MHELKATSLRSCPEDMRPTSSTARISFSPVPTDLAHLFTRSLPAGSPTGSVVLPLFLLELTENGQYDTIAVQEVTSDFQGKRSMLMIRLTRVGKKNFPTYRVVVQQRQKAPSSNVLEILGHYNPHTTPITLTVKEDRLQHWIKSGAQLSDTVNNLLVEHKLLAGTKRSIVRRKKVEAVPEAAAPAEPKQEAAQEEAPVVVETPKEEVPAAEPVADVPTEAPKEETPVVVAEPTPEVPAETPKEEVPAPAAPEAPTETAA